MKKDYLDGVGDTIDLVPIGAYIGKGKRTGAYGAYLLACYNADDETFETTCKLGTGFSDAALKAFYEFFNAEGEYRIADDKPAEYSVADQFDGGPETPDVWFKPCAVWEIKCADLSISPKHTAGAGQADEVKGIGLRFPRLLRERTDKGPLQCTTAEQIVDMFNGQDNRK